MAAEHVHPSITAHGTQPLVAEFVDDDSDEVRYFVDDQRAQAAGPSADAQAALSVIGAWSDIGWDELAESLDRIRHESRPTPPIELSGVLVTEQIAGIFGQYPLKRPLTPREEREAFEQGIADDVAGESPG